MEDYEGLIKLAKKAKKKDNSGLASIIGGSAAIGGAGGAGVAANRFGVKAFAADKGSGSAYGKWIYTKGQAKKSEQAASALEKQLKEMQAKHESYLKRLEKYKPKRGATAAAKKKYEKLLKADNKLWSQIPKQIHNTRAARTTADTLAKNTEAYAEQSKNLLSLSKKLKRNKKLAIGTAAALGLLGTGLLSKGIYDRNKNK